MPLKPYRSANPLIWGAVTGICVALIVAASNFFGTLRPDNALLETPFKAGFAGLGFGILIAMFRNWFNERHPGP